MFQDTHFSSKEVRATANPSTVEEASESALWQGHEAEDFHGSPLSN